TLQALWVTPRVWSSLMVPIANTCRRSSSKRASESPGLTFRSCWVGANSAMARRSGKPSPASPPRKSGSVSTPGEIAIQTELHPSGRWITIPVEVAGTHTIWAVLDTGAPVSAISPQVEQELSRDGLLLPSTLPRRHRLVGLKSRQQQLPDLE